MGQLEHGLYTDDCEGVHPDIIRQYYGTVGQPIHRAHYQTGAGHPSDEVYSVSGSNDEESGESSDEELAEAESANSDQESEGGASEEGWEDVDTDINDDELTEENLQELPQRIAADHAAYFHHKPIHVPKHACPFSAATLHNTFRPALAQVWDAGHIPDGFGILPHEWDDASVDYPTHEIIRSGRRGTKELRIALPDFIWHPRTIRWCQALDVMIRLAELAGTNVGSESSSDADSTNGHDISEQLF